MARPQRRREVDRERQRERGERTRRGCPSSTSSAVTREVRPESADRLSYSAFATSWGGGEHQPVGAAEGRRTAPRCRPVRGSTERRGKRPRSSPPSTPPPPSAPSGPAPRSSTNPGIGAVARGAGTSTSTSATVRPGRGRTSTTTRSARHDRLLDVVRDQHHRPGLGPRARARAIPASPRRVIASSAANGSSSASTGFAGEQTSAGTRPAGAFPPDSSAGRVRSNPASPNRSKPRLRLPGGRRRGRPPRAAEARGHALSSAPSHGSKQVAPGASAQAGAAPDRTGVRGPAGPQISSSSVLFAAAARGRPPRPPRSAPLGRDNPREGPRPALARVTKRATDSLDAHAMRRLNVARLLSPEPRSSISSLPLRGHYPTGSKGQRRGILAGRYPQPAFPASPPWFSGLPDPTSVPARLVRGESRAFVLGSAVAVGGPTPLIPRVRKVSIGRKKTAAPAGTVSRIGAS